MTDSSQTRIAYIEESTYGTTPATPAFQEARYTADGLTAGVENIVSNEIRADRNVSDTIQVGSNAGGNLDFELSYGSFDDFLESLMYSTWSSNVLKNGTTQKSFTLEKTFETGATDQFHRFTGCIVNGMSLSIQSQQIVTGSFDMVAKGMDDPAQAIITGATYTAPNTNDVMNAGDDFSSLTITGASGIELTALNLNITNNVRQQPVVGSIDSRGVGTGRFEVTGDLTAYFENEELYDLFNNGTASDISFKLGGASSKNYVFDMGKVKFEEGNVLTPGNDQDIFVQLNFRALYDGVDNTLQITRTA